jgi:hypothetical protein
MDVPVNYFAVLAAAVASMAVGFLWYGVLFQKPWMSMMGYTMESMKQMKMSPNQAYMLQFIASLVTAYVLSHIVVFATSYMQTEGPLAGASTGFWVWLGFIAPVTLGVVLWENKPWKLWLINASHYLVSLVVMGAILAWWM